MQVVRGSNPRLGGSRVSQFQASGEISTLQSRASGLQSTTQGIPSGPEKTPPSQKQTSKQIRVGEFAGSTRADYSKFYPNP